MAHELEMRNGKYSFAFTGDRTEIWHGLGQELPADAGRTTWMEAAGFNYSVAKVMALAALPNGVNKETDKRFLVREDNGTVLGFATESYHVVQPAAVWDWFENYITVDERFHIDAAGVLNSGEKLWMTARFNGGLEVAGDKHLARLLMSTSFDCSQPTINQATMTRVVCRNTMRVAHSDKRAAIKTRHSSKFNGAVVAKELAQIAQSIADYKKMGDAMAQVAMSGQQVADFLKQLLDIPAEATKDDVSTRKLNVRTDIIRALEKTCQERNTRKVDVWTALQGVTRYVDHEKSVRNADNDTVGRFDSATWGSGDAMKGKAMELLLPMLGKSLVTA